MLYTRIKLLSTAHCLLMWSFDIFLVCIYSSCFFFVFFFVFFFFVFVFCFFFLIFTVLLNLCVTYHCKYLLHFSLPAQAVIGFLYTRIKYLSYCFCYSVRLLFTCYLNISLSLRKHAYSNTLKISPPKNERFQIKILIFHISAQNIDCGHSLEPPRRGGSNEYPQSMFLDNNKKNNVYPCKPQFYYIKVGFNGGQNYIGMFSWCYLLYMYDPYLLPLNNVLFLNNISLLTYLFHANYSVVYEETQSNRVSDFRDFVCSLLPKAILFYFYCNSTVICYLLIAYLFIVYFRCICYYVLYITY